MRNFFYFLLGILLFGLPQFAFCSTITEIWQEKYSKIDFAIIEDGYFKPLPGFEHILFGKMPRNIIKNTVLIYSGTPEYDYVVKGHVYEM